MKYKLYIILIVIPCLLMGCGNSIAKNFGGNVTLKLKPDEKLEEITWKNDSLWYLTRPMRENEEPETHVFKENSDFGFEGSVTIIEKTQE